MARLKHAVKPIEKSPQQSAARLLRPEQQRRKRRAERERIERGEQNGNRDGDGELLVKLAGDSGNEGRRHKDGGENQRDANDRAGELFHRFQRRVLRRHALLDVPLHAFDHHDGVVHHQTDRQHQTKQRKRVDGKTEHAGKV